MPTWRSRSTPPLRRTSCRTTRSPGQMPPSRATSARRIREATMADKEIQDSRPLTRDELDRLAGEELPERAAMSLINANVAAPVNLALALNVASDNSVAYANATQTATITQTN